MGGRGGICSEKEGGGWGAEGAYVVRRRVEDGGGADVLTDVKTHSRREAVHLIWSRGWFLYQLVQRAHL